MKSVSWPYCNSLKSGPSLKAYDGYSWREITLIGGIQINFAWFLCSCGSDVVFYLPHLRQRSKPPESIPNFFPIVHPLHPLATNSLLYPYNHMVNNPTDRPVDSNVNQNMTPTPTLASPTAVQIETPTEIQTKPSTAIETPTSTNEPFIVYPAVTSALCSNDLVSWTQPYSFVNRSKNDKFTSENDLVISREVSAAKAHVASYGIIAKNLAKHKYVRKYTWEWVSRLTKIVLRNVTRRFRFSCIGWMPRNEGSLMSVGRLVSWTN